MIQHGGESVLPVVIAFTRESQLEQLINSPESAQEFGSIAAVDLREIDIF
jgi:hypothetical protein